MNKGDGKGNVPPPSRAWMVAGIAHGELSNDETEVGARSLLWGVERGIFPKGVIRRVIGSGRSSSVYVQTNNVRCTANALPTYHINRQGRQRQTGTKRPFLILHKNPVISASKGADYPREPEMDFCKLNRGGG